MIPTAHDHCFVEGSEGRDRQNVLSAELSEAMRAHLREGGGHGGVVFGSRRPWPAGQVHQQVGSRFRGNAPDDGQMQCDPTSAGCRAIFGNRVRWKAQLNVRNAIGSDSLLPVTVQPWGEVATTRIAPERRWYLTNTFSF